MNSLVSMEPLLIVCLINIIIVLGLYINALSGILQLCTAAIAGIGGYASAVLTTNYDWPFAAAVISAMAAGAICGAFLSCITARMPLFILKITTLAFGEIVVILAFNTEYLGGANSFTGIPLATDIFVALTATMLALYIAWRADNSVFGYQARCVRNDPSASKAVGISVIRVRIFSFALGAAVIAMGGAVQAHYLLIVSPDQLGFFVSLTYIIFLVAGGVQTLWGPVLMAISLTAAPEILRFADEYRMVLYGLIIVAVVLLKPEGIITRKRRT